MPSATIEFVLVRPRRAVNVAAACRALKNMGFSELRVVGSLAAARSPEARAAAYGAWDLLDRAREYCDVAAAVSDCHLAFGASGKVAQAPSQTGSASVWSPRQLGEFAARQPADTRLAVLLGPEQRGLSREELALCQHTLRIPSDPAQPSLNLAQAVLLIAYELSVAARAALAAPEALAIRPWSEPDLLEDVMSQWHEALVAVGYLKRPGGNRALLAELRRLAARARPNARESSLLRGIARKVTWAGRVARGRRGGR